MGELNEESSPTSLVAAYKHYHGPSFLSKEGTKISSERNHQKEDAAGRERAGTEDSEVERDFIIIASSGACDTGGETTKTINPPTASTADSESSESIPLYPLSKNSESRTGNLEVIPRTTLSAQLADQNRLSTGTSPASSLSLMGTRAKQEERDTVQFQVYTQRMFGVFHCYPHKLPLVPEGTWSELRPMLNGALWIHQRRCAILFVYCIVHFVLGFAILSYALVQVKTWWLVLGLLKQAFCFLGGIYNFPLRIDYAQEMRETMKRKNKTHWEAFAVIWLPRYMSHPLNAKRSKWAVFTSSYRISLKPRDNFSQVEEVKTRLLV